MEIQVCLQQWGVRLSHPSQICFGHMHADGVPVTSDYNRGLNKQVSKRNVHNKELLSDVFQENFRKFASNKI